MDQVVAQTQARALMPSLADVQSETTPLVRLAWPVVLAEIGWVAMGLVDTMLVGRLSPAALGGVSLGGGVFFATAIFGMGILLGLDFMVAHAFGAGERREMQVCLVQGVYVAVAMTVLLTPVMLGLLPLLPAFGVRPEVATEAIAYGEVLAWSFLPLFLFTALRRYLQATNLVKPVMGALISSNILNAAVAWVLIFGPFGFPAMGVRGAGWATVAARVYLFLFLLVYLFWRESGQATGLRAVPLRLDRERVAKLLRLGLPAAMQLVAEVGVFVTATAIVGTLDAISLAAHHIALSAASLTFMVPLGISSSAAVRVGQAIGRVDPARARAAGWAAIVLGGGVMLLSGLAFVYVPSPIVEIFTNDAATIALGASLLGIAAIFQLFDGIQVVSTGALRGLGNTRTPMIANLVGHWAIGLPLGCYLAFRGGFGVFGVWIGLCLGLVIVAVVLLWVWTRAGRGPFVGLRANGP